MRPASEVERRRLNESFAALCAIPSPFGRERAVADHVAAELRGLRLEVAEDGAAAVTGAQAGNLLVRIPARPPTPHQPGPGRSILLCAHLDTVPHEGVVEPVLVDDGWESSGDTILGADNKAAVAVLLAVARRASVEGLPVGVELLFTVSEENALAGAKAFDVSTLRSQFGYVFDHASPIGEVVVASPTYYRLESHFRGRAAHAGIRPEDGRSAIVAAAHAITSMRLGRIDEQTTANVGSIRGGAAGTNIVPAHCSLLAEARSLDDASVEALVAEMVDRCYDAGNEPQCECDVDVTMERLFAGYRHRPGAPQVLAAQTALEACGYTPREIVTGGGSDANALEAAGFPCTNLANGTQHNHEPTERVAVAALEGMLDVTFALLDAVAAP